MSRHVILLLLSIVATFFLLFSIKEVNLAYLHITSKVDELSKQFSIKEISRVFR